MAEIIAEPTALSKVIALKFKINDVDVPKTTQLPTNKQFNTTDTDAWFTFELDGLASTSGTYNLTLINLDDKSIFHHANVLFQALPFHYKLNSSEDVTLNEIRHAGRWLGQLVVTLSNGDTTARQFGFNIAGHILDGQDAQVILLSDYQALINTINLAKDDLAQYNIDYSALIADVTTAEGVREQAEINRAAVFAALVESEMVAQNVATKLTEKEATFAPRMLSLESELAETAIYAPEPNGVDDTLSLKNAITEFLASSYTTFKFHAGVYKLSGVVMESDIVNNKHLDLNNATIHDMRTINHTPIFRFNQSDTVSIKNFKVLGKNAVPLRGFSSITSFMSCTNFELDNVYAQSLMCSLVTVDPRRIEGPCEDFRISNIVTDHIGGAPICFSSWDHSQRPSTIRRGVVENCRLSWTGVSLDGIVDQNSWSVGINFAEALDLLEDVTFINCHVDHSAESGFHTENDSTMRNVIFIGCSSKFNGLKDVAVFGAGWYSNKGISLIGCASEGNKKGPIILLDTISTSVHGNNNEGYIDLLDKNAGHIQFDQSYIPRVDNVLGEQFMNKGFSNSYGTPRADASDKIIYRTPPNFKTDSKGRRYLETGFRTNAFMLDDIPTTFIVTLDVMYPAGSIPRSLPVSFARMNFDGDLLTQSGTSAISTPGPSDFSTLPVDTILKLQSIHTISRNSINHPTGDYLSLVVNSNKNSRVYDVSIRRLDKNTNLIADNRLNHYGYDFKATKFLQYNSRVPLVGEGLTHFKVAEYAGERWFTRDTLYTGQEFATTDNYPLTSYDKLELVIVTVADREITDGLTLIVKVGDVVTRIVPTVKVQKHVIVYDNSLTNLSDTKITVKETGRATGSSNIYFRIESLKYI